MGFFKSLFGGGFFGGGHFRGRHFGPDEANPTIPGEPIPPPRFRQGATVELVGVEIHLSAARALEVEAIQNPTPEELAVMLIALEEEGAL